MSSIELGNLLRLYHVHHTLLTTLIKCGYLMCAQLWKYCLYLTVLMAVDFCVISARTRACARTNVREFPQTKLDSQINSHFLLNEHGDPQFFFQVFAKNSLIKNIIEEEKKFDSGTRSFFLENISQLGVFWPRRGVQADHGTVRKSAIFPQSSNPKNSLNEAILLMSINEAWLSR